MSTDRWSICPQCLEEAKKKHPELAENEVMDWMLSEEGNGETLREDWDIFHEGYIFEVHYQAQCCRCDWEYKLSVEEDTE